MAIATVNLTLEDDFLEKIDIIARNESQTRTDIIYNLYAYGESVAERNNFTEKDIFDEIKIYRNNQ